jgi:hypothetical protein
MAAILALSAPWRELLLVIALAIGACEARGRRGLALGLALSFAVLATGFWVGTLERPYGLFDDPVATRWAADVSVAGWAGGSDGFVVGEPSSAAPWAWLVRRFGARAVLLVPTFLPVVILPAAALAIALLWRRPEAALAAILWSLGATGDLDTVRGTGFVPGLWARPGSSLLWVLVLAAVLLISRLPLRGVFGAAAPIVVVLGWAALGPQGPALGLPNSVLAVTLDQQLWLEAGAAGLWRERDRASLALCAGGALLVLLRGLGGPGDAWAGQGFLRAGLVLASATWLQSASAGLVTDAVRQASSRWRLVPERVTSAILVVVVGAGGALAWWDPVRIDPVAKASIEPVSEPLADAMGWIRAHTPATAAVVAADEYASAVAVLGGRRTLRAPSLVSAPDDERRRRLERAVLEGHPPSALLQRYGVRYVFLAPGQFREYGIAQPEDLEGRGALRLAYANDKGMRLYEVPPAPEPPGSFK